MGVRRSFGLATGGGWLGPHLRVGWTVFFSLFVALLIVFQPKKPRCNFLLCFLEVDNVRLDSRAAKKIGVTMDNIDSWAPVTAIDVFQTIKKLPSLRTF